MTKILRVPVIPVLLVVLAVGAAASSCSRTDSGGASPAWVLEAKVRLALLEKLGTDSLKIKVDLAGTKVILTGEVAKRATEELAEEVALAVPGVKKVDNRLKVVDKPEATGKVERAVRDAAREVDDAVIESRVKLAIADELGSKVTRIEVEATDGVVSLRGTVPDDERRDLAVRAAKGVSGVTKVVDLLKLKE
ncbi:MAG: BON domain-containing protein [Acidobacteria bacterium]|nr:BON domain-containing protein [Acidobacteriota bacterium]